MRKLLYALAASALLFTSWAQAQPELRSDHPERYTVVKGDTLWDISARFLNNPWYWPEIWHVNPQVANPHLIYPGDRLALVYIDGKPRITKVATSDVVKLSPQVRSEPKQQVREALMPRAARPSFASCRTALFPHPSSHGASSTRHRRPAPVARRRRPRRRPPRQNCHRHRRLSRISSAWSERPKLSSERPTPWA